MIENSAEGVRIAGVEPGSPAARAGLKPGMRIVLVDGQEPRDIIDWRWLASDDKVELLVRAGSESYAVPSVRAGAVTSAKDSASINSTIKRTLNRSYGEDWGITFADPLFDGLKTCCNACTFCFMTMLPSGLRPTLYERDDDFRLSFLQGNFVTLTNMTSEDVSRVIEQHLAPLHVSLHAVNPEARRRLMGANHAHGIEVLEQLLGAGIEVHVQIVVVPGENDGAELDATLSWIEQRPPISSVGIVPYGFTKFARTQAGLAAADAQAGIAQVAPYQQRSRASTGQTRFQLADEFYLLAGNPVPSAEHYDNYPQFEDGIGMVRSFIDEWEALGAGCKDNKGDGSYCLLITGEAFAPILQELIDASPFAGRAVIKAIENRFFGGNVDVTGLLTARDIIEQLAEDDTLPSSDTPFSSGIHPSSDRPLPPAHPPHLTLPPNATIVLPSVIFNADGLTLDDKRADDIALALRRQVVVVPQTAEGLVPCLQFHEAGA